ncbi:MAG: hypothetical protein HQ522_04760 [Bacteroidetes bacterium]|nr:hypothetical protein [Bacteroidota bacterium]
MQSIKQNPGWRLSTFLIVGISLAIGWGIRGNFGHEYGAAFAGCLAIIAGVILSGREDWRDRITYFAFFGALAWGFGATQSYMQVLSYSESGHAISQWYGYMATFYIGFLWAGIGGAGTAFVAVADKKLIVNIFKPLLFLFGAWFLLDLIEDPLGNLLQENANFDGTWSRHKSPLYWFDADYLPAFFALLGVCIYDLYQRKGDKNRFYLPGFATVGAVAGLGIQLLLKVAGLEQKLASALTYLQGDPSYINPETGLPAYEASNLLNNWPQWFGDFPQHVGWFIGLLIGIIVYFKLYGKFRNGASLFVYMGAGWLISFLIFPVLGSIFFADYGGLRMTPPRSDDWAGITGVFAGTSLWMWRNKLKPVAVASLISAIIGGLGFAGMQWFKMFMKSFGDPSILANKGYIPGTEEFIAKAAPWADWQAQNWHSFLEQSYGFANGIAVAVVLAYLASRIKIHKDLDEPASERVKGRWTRGFSAISVLLVLTYHNAFKNVNVWGDFLKQSVWHRTITNTDGTSETVEALWDLPILGRIPGIDFLHLTPSWWFTVTWGLLAIACIIIVMRHYRSPLAIFPKSSLAKGQIMYLILLWIMIVANNERALVGWDPSRLLTEWTIIVNGIICTLFIILLAKDNEKITIQEENNYKSVYKRLWIKAFGALIISSLFFLGTNRLIYKFPEYEKLNHKWHHTRFGPKASWKAKPNLKNADHK